MQTNKNVWMCVRCGHTLGQVSGGELYPAHDAVMVHTAGPNLELTCPECNTVKTWYTADPVVRAVYQLVDAVATTAAQSMIKQIGRAVHTEVADQIERTVKKSI